MQETVLICNNNKEFLAPPCAVVGRNRSQSNSRRVTPMLCSDTDIDNTNTVVLEKVLPNGDLYTGNLSGGVPHGTGKYLWSDGCMYEGEWQRGKTNGRGKFSWPSGATYEGYFKSGRMDGAGTFIGVDGDVYKGSWVCDLKHGYGQKSYANGDLYRGLWRNNLQDGQGRYIWSNGNEYAGEWKNGVISGRGVLTWANRNRYQGFWENGERLLTWSKGENATFEARKRSSVDGGRIGNFPRICIWELDGEAGDITCDIVAANVDSSVFY